MIQNTINLASYALAGAVAFALVGVIGVLLMRSVIKNLRSSGTDQEEISALEPIEQESPKDVRQSKAVSQAIEKSTSTIVDETKRESKAKVVSETKRESKVKVVSETKRKSKPEVVNKTMNESKSEETSKMTECIKSKAITTPIAKQIIFTKLSENRVGESFSMILEESLNIGRAKDKNDWAIANDHTVSSKHCKIYIADEKIYLIDLNSTNGTYVNQVRITHPIVLKDNDLVRMGSGEYRIVIRG